MVTRQADCGYPFDEPFYRRASALSHSEWVRRNSEWITDKQKRPFGKLSAAEQQTTRRTIETAVSLYRADPAFRPLL